MRLRQGLLWPTRRIAAAPDTKEHTHTCTVPNHPVLPPNDRGLNFRENVTCGETRGGDIMEPSLPKKKAFHIASLTRQTRATVFW